MYEIFGNSCNLRSSYVLIIFGSAQDCPDKVWLAIDIVTACRQRSLPTQRIKIQFAIFFFDTYETSRNCSFLFPLSLLKWHMCGCNRILFRLRATEMHFEIWKTRSSLNSHPISVNLGTIRCPLNYSCIIINIKYEKTLSNILYPFPTF